MSKSGKWCHYRRPTKQEGTIFDYDCIIDFDQGSIRPCPFKNKTEATSGPCSCMDYKAAEIGFIEPQKKREKICPHCGNTAGFVCNTCCRCGFNSDVKAFDWIRVYVEDLGIGGPHYLVDKHAKATRRQ